MIYFHSFRSPGLIIDIVRDIRELNELSRRSRKAGMIILGGGVCKHQIANAMLIVRSLLPRWFLSVTWLFSQRNGADYSVYIVGPITN
jgi:deoxyhypusine synthase